MAKLRHDGSQAFSRAVYAYNAGNLIEAELLCRKIIRTKRNDFDVLHVLAIIQTRLGKHETALASYDRALRLRPDDAEALSNRGVSLHNLKRLEEALASYNRALMLRPDYPEALSNRGNTLKEMKRFEEALASYDRALMLRPDFAETLSNRGLILHELKRFQDALASYDRALVLRPDHAEALYNRGNTLHGLMLFQDALASYDRALALRPDYTEALYNRGDTLHELNRFEEALASYDRALALRPDFAEALSNRGFILHELNRFEEALETYDKALALKPYHAQARFNRSMALLAKGRYAEGWEEYEWRWKDGVGLGSRPRTLPCPQWQGEDLTGKTIFLYPEQGYGDTIQFLRYVPLVAARGGRVILEVPPPLLRLAKRLEGTAHVFASDPTFEVEADLCCPLMSLPRAFGTTVATIPGEVPYLSADLTKVTAWRQRVADLPGLRVGLVWAGSSRPDQPAANRIDRRRSVTLGHFAPLGDGQGASFVSLQKGEAAAQTGSPPPGLLVHDWTDELADFADTAALTEALDLVISVDTSVAHLAGALGKPVWLLNRFDSCWRWLLDRDNSPWYPTMRIFRQPVAGDWNSVLSDIEDALHSLLQIGAEQRAAE